MVKIEVDDKGVARHEACGGALRDNARWMWCLLCGEEQESAIVYGGKRQ